MSPAARLVVGAGGLRLAAVATTQLVRLSYDVGGAVVGDAVQEPAIRLGFELGVGLVRKVAASDGTLEP